MCDGKVLAIVTEIRNLYSQQCHYADQIRELQEADDRKLIHSCRAREHPQLPELQYFTTVFEQQDAMEKARIDPTIQTRTKRLQTVAWVVIFVTCLALQVYQGSVWLTAGLLFAAVVVLMLVQQYSSWMRTPLCQNLRRQLIERGVPVCLGCGYDLRGTPERCPECGRPAEDLVSSSPRE